MNQFYKIFLIAILLATFSNERVYASAKSRLEKKEAKKVAAANMSPNIYQAVEQRKKKNKPANQPNPNQSQTNSHTETPTIQSQSSTSSSPQPVESNSLSSLQPDEGNSLSSPQPVEGNSLFKSKFSNLKDNASNFISSKPAKYTGMAAVVAITSYVIYQKREAIKTALGFNDTAESLKAKIDVLKTDIKTLQGKPTVNKTVIMNKNLTLLKLQAKLKKLVK